MGGPKYYPNPWKPTHVQPYRVGFGLLPSAPIFSCGMSDRNYGRLFDHHCPISTLDVSQAMIFCIDGFRWALSHWAPPFGDCISFACYTYTVCFTSQVCKHCTYREVATISSEGYWYMQVNKLWIRNYICIYIIWNFMAWMRWITNRPGAFNTPSIKWTF